MRVLAIPTFAIFLVSFGLLAGVQAQDANYPLRRIELVVPFPAGGTTDVITRLAAQIVSNKVGRPIIVDNKTGATGAIGSEFVAHAEPDGYTLLTATASTHAVLPAYRKLSYDTVSCQSAFKFGSDALLVQF